MIRNVSIHDAGQIAGIYRYYVDHTTVSFEIEAPTVGEMATRIADISLQYPYLVYEHQGCILGYAYAHRWKQRPAYFPTAETTVYVANGHQGQGIGRRLMQQLISECRQGGLHSLIACITSENTTSIDFHRSLGFTEVSRFVQVGCKFGRMLDVTDMQLML